MDNNVIEIIKRIEKSKDSKELKDLNKNLKEVRSNCKHNFSDWIDESKQEYHFFNECYSLEMGYVIVTYPKFKRICSKCGYIELSNDIEKKLIR